MNAFRSNLRPDVNPQHRSLAVGPHSEELVLDHEAVARALRPPKTPQFSSGIRPRYALQDRLNGAGVVGSIVPPSARQLELMRPTYARVKESRATSYVAALLVVLAAITGTVVYRDLNRTVPTTTAQ
jgi:hypothetical protein